MHLEVRATGGASGVIMSLGTSTQFIMETHIWGVHTGHNTTSATHIRYGQGQMVVVYCPNNNSDSDIDQRFGFGWEVIA